MQLDRVVFATITWARDPEEAQLLADALRILAGYGRPIFVADGGSDPDFLACLRELPHVTLVAAESPGVVGQTRASLRAALATDAAFIVYTEPDKRRFFEKSLPAFVAAAPDDERLGVWVAARDATSFATFPATQRLTEAAINALFAREMEFANDARLARDSSPAPDFCYGPLILNRALVPCLDGVDAALGWGWRFYLMGRARQAGYGLRHFEADLPCPPDQREDHMGERVHRMRQLSQNLQGVVLALQAASTAP